MKQPDSKRVRRSISRFRKLTLVSVALIMVISFIMVYRITAVLDHGSASRIGSASHMLLLAQRIRSTAFEIDTAVRNEQWQRLEQLNENLSLYTNELSSTHQALFGNIHKDLPNSTTAELDQIAAIDHPFAQLNRATKDLHLLTASTIRRAPYIDQQTLSRIGSAMEDIREAQGVLDPRLQRVVELFSARSRAEINQSASHARIGLLVLAAMLAAMVLFIIEPSILIVRRQLRELDLATRAARRADSVRWRLLTNMGHEFRTPMNAILGFAELLDEDALSKDERQRLSNSIRGSASQLAGLIETMLDMSAIESGQLYINPTQAKLRDILSPCIIAAQSKAQSKDLELRTQLDSSCDSIVLTEPKRLAQITDKLLDNALKFTQQGHIAIHARVDKSTEHDTIHIEISDTGIGIEDQEQQSIFDAFHQTQSNLTREFGGSGLGLSFARDLTRALGGDISVRSQPGQGSTFTISIETQHTPDAQPSAPTQQQSDEPKSPLHNTRILIVDDAKDNRVLLQHYFKSTGAQIDFAYDGQQAIERANRARDHNEPYQLILMDMQMPVLDGYSATRQLRASGFTTPIIALTAHALDGDREQCLAAGCDEYLTKPVNRNTLFQTCQRILADTTPDQQPQRMAA